MTRSFRVYTNPDIVGCEIAGALKNVIAIAVGTAAGLGYGDNAQAALVTRGLAELTRLGVALGGKPLTFAGLAGLGDLVATCTSPKSRNRTVGFELGRGRRLDEIVDEMNMVAEGVQSTAAVLELAARAGVEMPIAAVVGALLYEGRQPADLVLRAHAARGEARAARSAVTAGRRGHAAARSRHLVGFLGGDRFAVVDDAGAVQPERAGWELAWWIGADDRWHLPEEEVAVRQALVDGMPVVHDRRCVSPAATRCSRCTAPRRTPRSSRSRTSRPPRSWPRSSCGAPRTSTPTAPPCSSTAGPRSCARVRRRDGR